MRTAMSYIHISFPTSFKEILCEKIKQKNIDCFKDSAFFLTDLRGIFILDIKLCFY